MSTTPLPTAGPPPVVAEGEPKPKLTLLMVAGEASGDAHGAELIHALKQRRPQGLRIIGVGGPRMAAAGQEQLFDMTAHAVIGLTEVLKHFFKFRGFLLRIVALARKEKPDAVVLIDSSGFNLRLSPKLRRDLPGARIIYYISPQVWASRPNRVQTIARTIDLVLAILPFEKDWYAHRSPEVNVQWVGHPVLDRIQKVEKAVPNPDWIALLPGSRRTEISAHLPDLWAAARVMGRQRKNLKFILLSPNEEMQKFALDLLALQPPANFAFEYNIGYAVSHLSRCSLALVASGTASLECALVGIPQIVVYRVHPLTYFVGRRMVTVSYLSLINVMADEEIVPEFLQDRFRPEAVAQTALELLDNVPRRDTMRRRVAQIVSTLGGPGASQRAAKAILLEAALAKAK
jgi:lipid-A-disaccharide synthase